MTRPCKCGECAFFKNEDANGYGHCIITLNQYRCDDLCKFKEDHMSDVETLRALHHYQKWRRGGNGSGRRALRTEQLAEAVAAVARDEAGEDLSQNVPRNSAPASRP